MDKSSCPCTWAEPCHPHCTCVNGAMSYGCYRCCRYGSKEQQKKMGELIVAREKLAEKAINAARDFKNAVSNFPREGCPASDYAEFLEEAYSELFDVLAECDKPVPPEQQPYHCE